MSSFLNRKSFNIAMIFLFVLMFASLGFFGCGGGGGGGGGGDVTPSPTSTSGLQPITTYNWQVDSCSNSGIIKTGPEWTFSTASSGIVSMEGEVTSDMALRIAEIHIKRAKNTPDIMKKYGKNLEKTPDDVVADIKELKNGKGADTLAYVMQLKPTGYVVVPANCALPPVIAYSYKSDFSWNEAPENVLLHMLRDDIRMRLEALEKGEIPKDVRAKDARLWNQYLSGAMPVIKGKTTWGPLFTFSTWHQRSPYNMYCPMDPTTSDRSVVGCVATSMSQIFTYWGYPTSASFTSADDYVTTTRNISIDATTASFSGINYNNQNPSDDDAAKLSFATGVSVSMDYSSVGSYASIYYASQQMKSRFGYPSADYKDFSGGFSGTDIISSVKAGQPTVISIYKAGYAEGHALNVDGYNDTDSTYHLNFGWGGSDDGWYSLPGGMPDDYSIVDASIVNIYATTPTPTPTASPTQTPTPTPTSTPDTPTNPYPANGQSNVSVYVTLSWSDSVGADYYNIYIWPSSQTKPTTPTASGLTSPQYSP
ncbi:MAG: C10 family peptidase [Candidatus Eremiobacteraeota bacterium]|nr:C10 family peptidase [Candidatus Eremiobacteraeota bacterium]